LGEFLDDFSACSINLGEGDSSLFSSNDTFGKLTAQNLSCSMLTSHRDNNNEPINNVMIIQMQTYLQFKMMGSAAELPHTAWIY